MRFESVTSLSHAVGHSEDFELNHVEWLQNGVRKLSLVLVQVFCLLLITDCFGRMGFDPEFLLSVLESCGTVRHTSILVWRHGGHSAYLPTIQARHPNGKLLRFALQADAFYGLVSHQTVVAGKPTDDIVIISSQHRANVQLDAQLRLYTVPSLDPMSQNVIRPIRRVITFTVNHLHLQRPASWMLDPVEFAR